MEISLINELAKAKANAGSGGTVSQYLNKTNLVARAVFEKQSISAMYTAGPDYWNYHGGSQFSVGGSPWVSTSSARMHHTIRPFQIDQSTGAITLGSRLNTDLGQNSDWYYGSGYSAVAGPTVFQWDTTTPYWRGVACSYNVSGNSVSRSSTYFGSQGSGVAWASKIVPIGNVTWMVQSYGESTSTAWDFRASGTGTSVSIPSTNQNLSPTSNTSTQNIANVVTNFGATYQGVSPNGTLRWYRDSNQKPIVHVINSSGNNAQQYDQGSIIGPNANASTFSVGLDLSNGTQIHYVNTGDIILRNGSTLTNITSQADWIPAIMRYSDPATRSYVATAANTWMMITEESPFEIIEFSVNPSTYKVTILRTALLSTAFGNINLTNSGRLFITGTNNKFLVNCSSSSSTHSINVALNPLGVV